MSDKLDYKEAAARLGISVGALRNKVSAGEIIFIKEGKRVFFDPFLIDGLLHKKKAIRFTVALFNSEIEALELQRAKLSDSIGACDDGFSDLLCLIGALDKVIDGAKKAVKS